jgi:hypothetical protein
MTANHTVSITEQKPNGEMVAVLRCFKVKVPFQVSLSALEINPDDWYINKIVFSKSLTAIYLVRV